MYFLTLSGMPNRKNAFWRVQAPLWRLHSGPIERKHTSHGFLCQLSLEKGLLFGADVHCILSELGPSRPTDFPGKQKGIRLDGLFVPLFDGLASFYLQDLVICLSKLCDESPSSSAEWMMRLIGRDKSAQIGYQVRGEGAGTLGSQYGKNSLQGFPRICQVHFCIAWKK